MKKKQYVSPELNTLCCENSCSLMIGSVLVMDYESESSLEEFVDSDDTITW